MTQNRVSLKLTVNGELAEKYERIKRKIGLKNNSEVMRYLIRSFDLEEE